MEETNEKKVFKFKVDNKMYDSVKQIIAGNEILVISENVPTDRYRLDMKLKGGITEKISLDREVDLSLPGLEKFMTTPIGPTEG